MIHASLDILTLQNRPKEGVVNTVGQLGADASEIVGFDIVADGNQGFAVVTPQGATASELHAITLDTDCPPGVGPTPGGQSVHGLAYMLMREQPMAPSAQPPLNLMG